VLVMLHGRGADDDQLVPLYEALQPPYDACIVRAPVPLVPPTGYAHETSGRSWYLCRAIHRPEPVSFGDSLWHFEQLVREVQERFGPERRVLLAGCDQGAVLSLTLAVLAPDWLAGVVAIKGYVPSIDGWSLPENDMGRLPTLLVYDSNLSDDDQHLAESTAEEMRRHNAAIEIARVDSLVEKPLALTPVVSAWLDEKR
jgi:predicted esterase